MQEPSNHLDKRLNAVRPDLAAAHLKDQVEAPRYAEGRLMRVSAGKVQLHQGPDRDTPVDSELLYGDVVSVFAQEGNWAWVQNNRDSYVGYLPGGCLSPELLVPSHKVTALSTFAYSRPDIKTPLPYKLFLDARLVALGEEGDFLRLHDGLYVHKQHVGGLDQVADDYVAVAERFIGVPYLWGGRSSDGIDCSGLVQVSMQMAGLDCPRDSDMQRQVEGEDIATGSMEDPQRGDLVFWPGHVGIMLNDAMLLHANAHHMEVAVQPLHEAIYYIASDGTDMLGLRRPARLSASS